MQNEFSVIFSLLKYLVFPNSESLGQKKKKKGITLPTKVCIVKIMVFLVVMNGFESWPIRRLSTEEWMLSNLGAG